MSYKHLTWTFFHVEPRWHRVSKTRFVIIFHHFSVQTKTLSHPNIQIPTRDKRRHYHWQTHQRRLQNTLTPKHTKPLAETIADIKKPIGKDKRISSTAENSCLLSSATSIEFYFFFLTIFWVLHIDQTQIVQSWIAQSDLFFVIRPFLSSSSLDR